MAHIPLILPLGDGAALVRFGEGLSERANGAALGLARALAERPVAGVLEVAPNLVSVLLRYDPRRIGFSRLSGEIGLIVARGLEAVESRARARTIPVRYDGPDLEEVAEALKLTVGDFIAAHGAEGLRVIATGFAPGFIYCGFHDPALTLPRRRQVRPGVEAGCVLFAAGQTAVTSTPIPTGWHVIGHTDLVNFDPQADPPTSLVAGDPVRFEAVA